MPWASRSDRLKVRQQASNERPKTPELPRKSCRPHAYDKYPALATNVIQEEQGVLHCDRAPRPTEACSEHCCGNQPSAVAMLTRSRFDRCQTCGNSNKHARVLWHGERPEGGRFRNDRWWLPSSSFSRGSALGGAPSNTNTRRDAADTPAELCDFTITL